MQDVKLIFCEDNVEDGVFKGKKAKIESRIKNKDKNRKVTTIICKTVEEFLRLIDSQELMRQDVFSLDCNLGTGADDGGKIIDKLVDKEFEGFVLWHSPKQPPTRYSHIVFHYNSNEKEISGEYEEWVKSNHRVIPLTNYLNTLYILSQAFIVADYQKYTKSEIEANTIPPQIRESLMEMGFKSPFTTSIAEQLVIDNIYTSSWWNDSLGLQPEQEFCKEIDQELKVVGLSTKNLDLKFEKNVQSLLMAITTGNMTIKINDVIKVYFFLNQLFKNDQST